MGVGVGGVSGTEEELEACHGSWGHCGKEGRLEQGLHLGEF